MVNYSMTNQASIHNGEKTDSSISGVEKTGQPHVKRIKLDYLHHIKKLTQNRIKI